MVYSKLLKPSHSLASSSLKGFNFSQRSLKCNLLNNRVLSAGTTVFISKCQYSTVFKNKFSHPISHAVKYSPHLQLTALLSTGGNNETYQIVFSNPAEGTTSTLGTSLDSINEVSSVSAPISNVTDVAASFTDQASSIAEVVEPAITTLGLGNYTPVGGIQLFLEYLHVTHHMPWWMTIVACTVIARILLIPLLIKTQRNAINMSNHMPQLQYLQTKFGEARRTGNSIEASRYANEMMIFMKEHKISPMKNAMLPLMQAPIFLSFFFALRNMAQAPVESFKYGGISWVADLTVPDPYYALPILACSTLYVILKVGAESGVRMENLKFAKYFVSALPVIALPFCINFPSAVLYYWVVNNFCTLGIVSILKIQPVRVFLNLPSQQKIDPKFVAPKKGFFKGVKDAYEDQKIIAAVEDRRRIDDIRFQKAGTGPIPRTYSYDPTKPRPSNVASIAKNMVAKERKV